MWKKGRRRDLSKRASGAGSRWCTRLAVRWVAGVRVEAANPCIRKYEGGEMTRGTLQLEEAVEY
jgi:hypothetical protein